MNVGMHNNIAMMSSMVGVPQQAGAPKQATKDVEAKKDPVEPGKAEDAPEQEEGASQVSNRGNAPGKADKATQQQNHQVGRRHVSEEMRQEKAETRTGETAATEKSAEPQGPKTDSNGRVLLDTTSQIAYKFNKVHGEKMQEGQESKSKPDVQRRQFADNLKKWVDTEYKQFVKNNEPLYTRRNLREILAALGDQDPSAKKTKSEKDNTAGKSTVQYSKYNKYNITQASTAMRIFEEIPSNMEHQDFDLVA